MKNKPKRNVRIDKSLNKYENTVFFPENWKKLIKCLKILVCQRE